MGYVNLSIIEIILSNIFMELKNFKTFYHAKNKETNITQDLTVLRDSDISSMLELFVISTSPFSTKILPREQNACLLNNE